MSSRSKLYKLFTTDRHQSETEDWMFSLVPIGVAFSFYIVFILSTNIEQKGLFLAYGAAAGFIGLESYWIVRGWRKNHVTTIVMGLIGIIVTLILLYLYMLIA
jgi:hypothetical protein